MSLIFGIIWQDIVLSLGGVIGTVTLGDALIHKETTWPLRDSLVRAVWFLPSVVAYWTLDLYLVAINSFITALIWTAIAIFRRPSDNENKQAE